MRIVAANEIQHWLESGQILEKDPRGPKVVALKNNSFLKIFYTRKHPFLARLQPANRKFAQNSISLRQLDFNAPKVTDLFWVDRDKGISGCLYDPLPGRSLEKILNEDGNAFHQILPNLAAFIFRLHKQGVYFRSLHLGNIIDLGNGSFGLIDILDLRFKRKALSRNLIKRNFLHLENYIKRSNNKNFQVSFLKDEYEKISGIKLR